MKEKLLAKISAEERRIELIVTKIENLEREKVNLETKIMNQKFALTRTAQE